MTMLQEALMVSAPFLLMITLAGLGHDMGSLEDKGGEE